MSTEKTTDLAAVVAQLSDKSSAKRRSAAKQIGATRDQSAGQALHEAFLRERQDARSWETQCAMANALGLLAYAPAAKDLLKIVQASPEHDMLGHAAALAYCRIARSSLHDAQPVLKLLELNRFSVATGALLALGCDRMVPSDDAIREIIKQAGRWRYEKGFGDPRYGAAVAAAGWRVAEVREFLEECLKSADEGLVQAAESSLKHKYVRCR